MTGLGGAPYGNVGVVAPHWKHCTRHDCPGCLPLKQAERHRVNTNDSLHPGQNGLIGGMRGVAMQSYLVNRVQSPLHSINVQQPTLQADNMAGLGDAPYGNVGVVAPHWKHCTRNECPGCLSLKQVNQHRVNTNGGGNSVGGGLASGTAPWNPTGTAPTAFPAVTGAPVPQVPSQPPTSTSADRQKRKLIQKQLAVLLHAHKCKRRDNQSNGENSQCTLPHCMMMKNVLNHLTTCRAGRICSVPYCLSSRQIISHWKHCTRPDCPVCLPLKQAVQQRVNTNEMPFREMARQ